MHQNGEGFIEGQISGFFTEEKNCDRICFHEKQVISASQSLKAKGRLIRKIILEKEKFNDAYCSDQ